MRFELKIKNGKFDFDKALEKMDFHEEAFEAALEKFSSIQSIPFKNELLKQYTNWKTVRRMNREIDEYYARYAEKESNGRTSDLHNM